MSEPGGWRLPTALAAIEIVAALIWGPRSCAGGLEVYFGLGGAVAFAALLFPWLRHPRVNAGTRSVLGSALTVAAWIGGLFLGNFQIFCRLF